MTKHCEVLVKVNAWVDAGIADLVTALSEIDGLVTIESCQGDQGNRDAFVYFCLGDWKDCAEFLFGQLLGAMDADLRSSVSIRLQAYDTGTAICSITLEPSAVPAMARCIRKLAWKMFSGAWSMKIVTRAKPRQKSIPSIRLAAFVVIMLPYEPQKLLML